jgi:short-subunit dehydrogenase involved in D-alanine esterification of teichoic acids
MNDNEIKMWQKLIIGEATQKEFDSFIKDRYKVLNKLIQDHGLDRALDMLNPNDYPDPELHKLINYYVIHVNLIHKYIEQKIKKHE